MYIRMCEYIYAYTRSRHASICATDLEVMLQRVAVRCSMLQYTAVWFSVLQCVAACCSAIHYGAVSHLFLIHPKGDTSS